jgi:hypothetical protein
MIDSLAQFQAALATTPLAARELLGLPILDTGEEAYAMRAAGGDIEPLWREARALVSVTGRWPVATQLWSGASGNFAKDLENADLFSRFYYLEAPDADDVSPRALIDAASAVDVDGFVATMKADRDEVFASDEVELDYAHGDTLQRCGKAPTMEELEAQDFASPTVLERWMLDWELQNGGIGKPENGRQDFFEPDDTALILFLPTSDPWETLAYLNWYGTSRYGSEHYIALGRRWQQRHGAELFAHYGTMIECFVSNPPSGIDDAFELAQEHDLAGTCTLPLPGITLRNYAAGLLRHDRWFLHDRP